jgi:hypothetical protein
MPVERGCSFSEYATPYDPNSDALNRFDFDHNPTPMWVFDVGTLAFSAVNHAAVRHCGYSPKEFVSMTILDIRPSEDIPLLFREILQKRVLNSARQQSNSGNSRRRAAA